jgi:hypothetical protein
MHANRSNNSSDGEATEKVWGFSDLWSPEQASVCWPLLPKDHPSKEAAATADPGPVLLEQLQMAVFALQNSDPPGASAAALLLALLLQQAGPGLRAEFLGGPGGTTLLAAAQYWGYYQHGGGLPLGGPYTTLALYTAALLSAGHCKDRLLAAVEAQGRQGPRTAWREQPGAQTAVLLLAWCYLQPVPGWWEDQLLRGGLADQRPGGYFLAATPAHIQALGTGGNATAGGYPSYSTRWLINQATKTCVHIAGMVGCGRQGVF